MSKRFIGIVLILLIVMVGLFAGEDVEFEENIPLPSSVNAYLKANVKEYLYHGFLNNLTTDTSYDSTITVLDAFNTTPPSFNYGYITNAEGKFRFQMTVTDFMHTNGIDKVVIDKVEKVTTPNATVIAKTSGYYLLFSDDDIAAVITSGAAHTAKGAFRIYPKRGTAVGQLGDNTTAGEYTSTVTIEIVTHS